MAQTTIKAGAKNGQKARCKCPHCKVSTNHTVLASVSSGSYIEGPEIHCSDEYDIVQCDGCESICFRHEHSNSEDIDYHTGQAEVFVKSYPDSTSGQQGGAAYITDEVYSMPGIVQAIYSETLGAIRNKLPVLAGVGIRAIVEAVCHDQKAIGKDLQKKIESLVTQSLLTQKGADILHGIRVIGNDAAHQLKAPSTEQVAAAMKVIDHLLIGAYVIPEEAKVLPVPSRKAAASTGSNPPKASIASANGTKKIKKKASTT